MMKARTQVALGALIFTIMSALGAFVGKMISGDAPAAVVVQAPVEAVPMAADATAVDVPGLASPVTP